MAMKKAEATKTAIQAALSKIKHPEIKKHDLVTLGMIPEIRVEDDRVIVKLAFPYPETPIADKLIAQVRDVLQKSVKDVQIDIESTQMTPRKRASFMAMARGEEPRTQSQENVANVLAIMSGKGGVGKSSMAGLLASSLKRRGLRIGILDADITGPSIPKIFGIHQTPVAGPDGVKPVQSSTGIEVMSINLLLPDEDQPVVWRGPLIAKAIEQFWKDIAWSKLDYLIIDLPPGTSDAALTVMQSLPLDGIVLVTSPQDLAGMVVRKAANMAKRLGIKLVGVVENMSHVICPECGTTIEVFGPSQAEATAETIGTQLLGRMPLALELSVLCDRGEIEQFRNEVLDDLTDLVVAGMDSHAEGSA
ncbi:MAG: Mrp/NBP35 family ATP-binding protein [Anaerolineales bacterium]|jgi:Mrp family chromosome partitioning ATPase